MADTTDDIPLDSSPLDDELFGDTGDELTDPETENEDGGSDEGDKLKGSGKSDGEDDGEVKGKGKSEKEEVEIDLDALDELDGEEDVELAEAAPVDIAKFNKEFPDVLKKHPELKTALIREQRFTEFFPTVEDAEEAYKRSEGYRNFEHELAAGQSENLLRNVHQLDPKAYVKFTDGILDSIKKLSPERYNDVVGPVFADAIKRVYKNASKNDNKEMALAARYISLALFDQDDPDKLEGPKRRDNESEEVARVRTERAAWVKEQYTGALDNVQEQIENTLLKEIKTSFDPNKKLNEVTLETLSEKTYREVDKVLAKDPRHNNTMRILWARAEKAGFNAQWRNRIRDAYLTNARRVLPAVQLKIKSAAFKNNKPGKVTDTKLAPSGKATGNKPQSERSGNSSTSTRKIDYTKTSDADIMAGRITYLK